MDKIKINKKYLMQINASNVSYEIKMMLIIIKINLKINNMRINV